MAIGAWTPTSKLGQASDDAKELLQADDYVEMRDLLGVDNVFAAELYDVVPDGTDQTAALSALLFTAYNAGGGRIVFKPGTYRIDGQISQPPLTTAGQSRHLLLQGAGSWGAGPTSIVTSGGGTVFDLRYNHATNPKFLLGNAAVFGCEGITFNVTSPNVGANGPIIFVGFGIPWIIRCGFTTPQEGTACTVDGIVCGDDSVGASPPLGFQGYGAIFKDNSFQGIRRALYARRWANAIRFTGNNVWTTCGHAGGAVIEIDGPTADSGLGIVCRDNLLECLHYTYAARVVNGSGCVFEDLIFDGADLTAAYRADAGAIGNKFGGYFNVGAAPFRSEAIAGNNVWENHQYTSGTPRITQVPQWYYGAKPLVTVCPTTGSGATSRGTISLDTGTGAYATVRQSPNSGVFQFVRSLTGNVDDETVVLTLTHGTGGTVSLSSTQGYFEKTPASASSTVFLSLGTPATLASHGFSGFFDLAANYWNGSASVTDLARIRAGRWENNGTSWSAGNHFIGFDSGIRGIPGANCIVPFRIDGFLNYPRSGAFQVLSLGLTLPTSADASVPTETLYFSSNAGGALSVKEGGVVYRINKTPA